MCLVEVEGMPKLPAPCTLTAGDGMKVPARLENAAQGPEAVLEFILLNHPLDPLVCDKGGECPLQDLTYRYGPGNTRFHLNKRTYEKPRDLPLIALDRERCILCYRCTRFSQDVAQDEQLVARERGATPVIATFEDEPYRGRFSGNVIELCPVGALTSTVYRFRARPWEINDIPSVCGMCAVGCDTWAPVREGDWQRNLSRNHPEVDEGWLCDRGRFTLGYRRRRPLSPRPHPRPARARAGHCRAARRVHRAAPAPPRQPARPRLDRCRGLRRAEQRGGPRVGRARARRRRRGIVSTGFSGAGEWDALAPYAARIADIDRADVIVVSGERELGDAAGVLELPCARPSAARRPAARGQRRRRPR